MIKWVVGVVVVIAVIVVGGPFVYIHFIEGPAPKPLALPATTTSPGHTTTPVTFPSGTWTATTKSVVGYRVDEVLFGQNNVAVGRTHSVKGSITLSGSDVSAAGFSVPMATVHSDQSQRDAQFDGRIMDVERYPSAKFDLTGPIALGHSTASGVTIRATATGNLTLHGQTHAVTFGVTARYGAGFVDVSGSIPITFATWGIANPSFGSAITTANNGILEFLLVLHPS